jgi:hypothetical protein
MNGERAMEEKTVYDWGQSLPLAPSIQRVDPLRWVVASLVLGSIVALLGLLLIWRPIPGLGLPPGQPLEHGGHWLKLLARVALPLFFADDARIYKHFYAGLANAERRGLIFRGTFVLLAFIGPWIILAKSFLRPRDGLIHMRGSRRHSGKEAVRRLVASLRERVKRRPDHEIAPGVVYPADMFTRHVLVVAGVGAGKSTALKGLIDKVVSSGEQMLLFDPKSEFTIGFAKPEIIAPWDSRSLAWDIARDMRNLLDMRRFAATMIRESQDPMWSNASRQLLVGLMIYLKGTRDTDWGWDELRELVALPQAQLLSIMKDWHPEAMRAVEDDPDRKIWFIADEFAQMGKIPVRPLFEVGRSRGVRCVVACQDFAQLEELYGASMVKALTGMCGTLLVGQIMQGETAEQICKAFGSREVERVNTSSSYNGAGGGPNGSTTLSFNREEVDLYKPSELSSRLGLSTDGTGVTLILFTGGQAYELFWPHYKMRRERPGHMPAPWTTGVAAIARRVEQAREDAGRAKAAAADRDAAGH